MENINVAHNGSLQEDPCPEAQTLHEDLSRMRSTKLFQRRQVQKMQKQESAMEET
jgi:hypothetical protein